MQTEIKTCTKCLLNLPIISFYKDSSNKNGFHSQCKLCKNNQTKLMRKNRIINNIDIPYFKVCARCKTEKKYIHFTCLKSSKDGLATYCKECRHLNDIDRKNIIKTQPIFLDNTVTKICIKCNTEKTINCFRITRKSNDNVSYICLECLPKNNWNKEKQRISEKKYRLNNSEKIKAKYKKDGLNINRRIRDSLNHRISEALFTNKVTKNNNTINYIGCTIPFLKDWIEYQFIDNMCWDNYGKWHLDHVKPCASYNLENDKDIKECFNWKNYQPLWCKDNLIKSNKIDFELIKNHIEKACNYEKYILNFSAQVKEGELLEHPEVHDTTT
jgi:hypothetical protein